MSLTLIAQAELPPQPTSAPASEAPSISGAPSSSPEAAPASGEAVPAAPVPGPDAGEAVPAAPVPGSDAPTTAAPEPAPVSELPPLGPEAAAPASETLTSSVAMPSAPPQDMSVKHMFLNADPVVQGVMLLLLLASVATWVVIFEKAVILRRASFQIMLFKRTAAQQDQRVSIDDYSELAEPIVVAGVKESGDDAGNETRTDYRERVERAMRAELSGLMDRLGRRTLFLASVGSVSPFVGLFGTVWGIMHSFIGIAASGETTLAVVAPGIAEALFATAMGLVAAIPAVVAYNKITGTLKKITKEALTGIGLLGNHLARNHFQRG